MTQREALLGALPEGSTVRVVDFDRGQNVLVIVKVGDYTEYLSHARRWTDSETALEAVQATLIRIGALSAPVI